MVESFHNVYLYHIYVYHITMVYILVSGGSGSSNSVVVVEAAHPFSEEKVKRLNNLLKVTASSGVRIQTLVV